MQREAREHIQRRAALLEPFNRTKTSLLSCLPSRDQLLEVVARTKSLAFRVSRHRILLRLLHFFLLAVFFGWVVFFRLFFQQSYALPGTGDVFSSSPPRLLWRDFNPSSPRVSPASMSSCASSLNPLVGDWSGSCEQLLGINILDQPVCASSPCKYPFAVSYSAAGFVRRHSAGLPTSSSSCLSAVPVAVVGKEVIEVSSPLQYMKNLAAKSAWFPGDPHSVTVDQLGCYNAWVNATHYQEEGNYDSNWRFADLGACPACGTRGALARPGVCTAFGESVVCDPVDGSFSYRCSAIKTSEPSRGTSIFAGKWFGWCEQKRTAVFSTNGRNLGFACTSIPNRQEYTVTYEDDTVAFFTGPQLQRPILQAMDSLSIPATGVVSGEIPLMKFTRSQSTLPRGSWFSDEPWSVSLADGQGCYEAWANDTHYEEMGNGFNVSGISISCPSCALAGGGVNGSATGQCRADGALSCASSAAFNYRCTARRSVPLCYTPSHISDYIIDKSPSSLTFVTVRNVASPHFSSTEVFLAGWSTLQVVVSPTFLNGQEPYPYSAYPSTASLVSASSSVSASSLKLTSSSSSSSFGYATTAKALVAAAGIPETIEGVPWQQVGITIDLVLSASRSSTSVNDVVIRVSRWSSQSPSPRLVGSGLEVAGHRGIDLVATSFVKNKSDSVYFSGILLSLAEGLVLCCLCYVALFVLAFVFYGVRQMRGGSGAPELAAEIRREARILPSVAKHDAEQLGDATTPSAALNGTVVSGDVVVRVGDRDAAEDPSMKAESNSASAAQLLLQSSGELLLANQHTSAATSIDVAAINAKPSVHDNSGALCVTPSPAVTSSATVVAPVFAPVAITANMLNSLDSIVSSSEPSVSSTADAVAPSAAVVAVPNTNVSLPSTNALDPEKMKHSKKSSLPAESASDAAVVAPSQAPAPVLKSKQTIVSKEAVTTAIDMFNASVPAPAPPVVPLQVKPAPAFVKPASASQTNQAETTSVAPRASNVTSPVPKLDLTKAVLEQAREMGVNLKDQQKREAELRRKLELQPPLPDSDDEFIATSAGPSASSSSAAASMAAAGSDILDKAGDFFKNIKAPVAMFSSEPSTSAAPIPATRVASAATASSAQPKHPNQDPLPPSSTPGLQDFQRKSLRIPGAPDAKAAGAGEKVVRPLSFAPSTKQPVEARGAKPDFLTPPPPQAPERTVSASASDPPDSSSMFSVESVMSKIGSPFTSMFSSAPTASEKSEGDGNAKQTAESETAMPSSSSGGIMGTMSSSFGSLFTNAPERVAKLFSPSAPGAAPAKPRPGSPQASETGSAWDTSSVTGSQISGSASVMSESLAGLRRSNASAPSVASSQASSSSKSSVARSVVSTAGDAIQWTNLNPKSGLYNLVQQLQLRSYLDEEQAQALKTMIRTSDPLLIGLYQSFEARGFTDFDDFSRPLQRIARRFVESKSKGEALRPGFHRQ